MCTSACSSDAHANSTFMHIPAQCDQPAVPRSCQPQQAIAAAKIKPLLVKARPLPSPTLVTQKKTHASCDTNCTVTSRGPCCWLRHSGEQTYSSYPDLPRPHTWASSPTQTCACTHAERTNTIQSHYNKKQAALQHMLHAQPRSQGCWKRRMIRWTTTRPCRQHNSKC
jgi:hypothetical protein